MKKYSKLILTFIILFVICCSNGSDILFESINGEERSLEEIKEEKKDIYLIIPPLFSPNTDSYNPLMSSRFILGEIETSLSIPYKIPFWEISEFMKSFVSSFNSKKEEKREETKEEEIEIALYSLTSSFEEQSNKGVITLDTSDSACLSYSLDGESFEFYSTPIEITKPSVITVKTKADGKSKHFLSTAFSYSFEITP